MGTPKKAAPKKAAAQPKATAPAKNEVKVGSTCQYTPAENDQELSNPLTVSFAAIINEVKADGIVNLTVFANGPYGPFFRSNVPAGSGPHTWA